MKVRWHPSHALTISRPHALAALPRLDKALDPVHIRLLSAQAVMLQAQPVPDLIEQFRLSVHVARGSMWLGGQQCG